MNRFRAATLTCLCGLMPILHSEPIDIQDNICKNICAIKQARSQCKSILKHIQKQSLPATTEIADNDINTIEDVYNWLLAKKATIKLYGYDSEKNFIQAYPFNIPNNARVFPVCQAGINRSQVLYKVLDTMYGNSIDLLYPHGAEKGFDPYCGTFDNFLWIINKLSFAKIQFEAAFESVGRVPRICEEYSQNNKIDCASTRELFTNVYYQIDDTTTPHVFIVFKQAAAIVITRIMEANYNAKDLSNLIIIVMNYDDWIHNPKLALITHDPIWCEGSTPKKYSSEGYRRFSEVIARHFIK